MFTNILRNNMIVYINENNKLHVPAKMYRYGPIEIFEERDSWWAGWVGEGGGGLLPTSRPLTVEAYYM